MVMTVEYSVYKDLCRLAVERCREAALRTGALFDDDQQMAGLLVSIAADLVHGAATYLEHAVGEADLDADEAMAMVVSGLILSLGEPAIDRGSKKLEARKRDGKATYSIQPGSARASKSNPKKG
jgi:hypothetical protein